MSSRYHELGGSEFEEVCEEAAEVEASCDNTSVAVADAIDALGFGRFQRRMFCICGMFMAADAMEMMLLSYLSPSVRCEWDISPEAEASLTTVVFVGMFLGASLWGKVADRWGRRPTLMLIAAVTFVFGVLSALSVNFLMLLMMRSCLGFCVGGFGVAFSFFLELLPTRSRGWWGTLIQAMWTVGTVFEAALAWIILPNGGSWRWLAGLSALPLLLVAVALRTLPESPRFLLVKGREAEAQAVLKSIAAENRAHLPEGALAVPVQTDEMSFSAVLRRLFSPEMRHSTLLVWVIWFTCAFCYYGLVLMTTALAQEAHAEQAMESGNGSASDGLLCNIGGENVPFVEADFVGVFTAALSEFPGTLAAMLLVDRIGRKRCQSLGFLFAAVFLLLMAGIPSSQIGETALLFCARALVTGAFLVAFIYTPEIYPTAFRTSAFGLASSFGRVGGMLCPFVGQDLLERGLDFVAKLIFACFCLFAAVASARLPDETAGIQLPEDDRVGGSRKVELVARSMANSAVCDSVNDE